jgi:hypothetical protein
MAAFILITKAVSSLILQDSGATGATGRIVFDWNTETVEEEESVFSSCC